MFQKSQKTTKEVLAKDNPVNPKDRYGIVKPSVTKIPPAALLHCSLAMMDGAKKYGAYNWREKEVILSIYIDAAIRHLLSYYDGEQLARDSKVHHLGHAMACCAILLDAEQLNVLVDDRPTPGQFADVVEQLVETNKV